MILESADQEKLEVQCVLYHDTWLLPEWGLSFHPACSDPVQPPVLHPCSLLSAKWHCFHSHVYCCHKSRLPIGRPAGLRFPIGVFGILQLCGESLMKSEITRGYLHCCQVRHRGREDKLSSHALTHSCMYSERSSALTRKMFITK